MTRVHGLILACIMALLVPPACSASDPSRTASCPAGEDLCGGVCVVLSNNSANCGKCGAACAVGSGCMAGSCACQAGALSCGTQCVNVSIDPNNCGGCGTKCQPGQLCTPSGTTSSCQCASGLMNCSSSCVDVSSSPSNCGTCGTACTGNLVCSLGNCKAGCDQGLAQCGQACVDTKTSLSNCGACNTACSAGQVCSNGLCGCPNGQTLCGGQCVNSTTDALNCGACGAQCSGGRACTGGVCGCPSGQIFCNNSCVTGTTCSTGGGGSGGGGAGGSSAGGAGGAGGSNGGSGGSGGGGAVVETPVALTCAANGTTFTVPAGDVISDFRGMPINYAVGGRGDTGWYAFGAQDPPGASTGASTPGVGGNVFAIDPTMIGPCNSGGALKVSSTGNDGLTQGWGVGFGVNMMPTVPGVVGKAKFDAKAAGYTGIGFFMKCQAETDFAYIKIVDAANDADVANPTCSYNMGAPVVCNQYGQKNATVTTDWTYFKVHFSETLQDWENGTITTTGLNASALTAFQIQMNTKYTRDGTARVKNGFTCWVDDVHFVKDTPPSASAAAAPKTCTVNAANAAPGGYTTATGSGTITDCKTGQPKIFRGIARPSFEWDPSGWNVTYEDLSRMAAWKANVVRFSLNQSFWLDPVKGGLYQASVDRAVKWSLSLGMDVILDLHWLTMGQTPISDGNSPAFWTSVAKKYANEGRVLFELFNEPNSIDSGTWKTAMTGLYNAVRGAGGAKNLVLIGGLDWAYNLSTVSVNGGEKGAGLPANAISGTNIAYVTHPYSFKAPVKTGNPDWFTAFGQFATQFPIIATEFGNANTQGGGAGFPCDPTFYDSIIKYFAANKIGWTAWAWFVDRGTDPSQSCGFPQVITSYSGVTNSAGAVIKTALAN